ncbi:MAG: lipase secretion chaperone [Smithellaceae bacterium]|jgi:lipase chaperone LimK
MYKKKIITSIAIIFCLAIIIIIPNHFLRKDTGLKSLSDENYRDQLLKSELSKGWKDISNEDARRYLVGNKDFSNQKAKNSFADTVVNNDTLAFFIHLDELFQDSKDFADNLEKARKYLYSVLPPQQAGEMLDLYKKYLTIQFDYHDPKKSREISRTPEEAIANLYKLQEDRRAIFGKEKADIIFGAEVKSNEYFIRRNVVIADSNMTGLEKERKLGILNESMWGSATAPFDENKTAYELYQDKLNLYSNDFSALRTEEEKAAFKQQLQRETLSPEQIQSLADVESQVAEEKKIREQYFAQEKEILNDPSITQETKDMKIRELQDATFGEEAEAFRRGEAIQKETEQFTKGSLTHQP